MNLPATTGAALPPAKAPPRSVLVSMASRYSMEPAAFEATLRGTVFPTGTREELAAFLVVAHEYKLNPLTRQIYAFPKKGGGIVPVVGIDGWIHLVNTHPQFDGMEFEFENDDQGRLISCTCRMYRKDRSKPVVVTEYLEECIRQTDPWKMKRRMLRHKAMIQGARYAFGFSGIHDEDEARDIADSIEAPVPVAPPPPPGSTKPAEIAKPVEQVEEGEIIQPEAPQVDGDYSRLEGGYEDTAVDPFDANAWLETDVKPVYAGCKTEQNVDEAHAMFEDTVDTMLSIDERQRYQEIHEEALTRVTDAAMGRGVLAPEPAAATEQPAGEAEAAPEPAAPPAAASSLDDDEDETKVIDKGALYLARGDAVLTDPKRTRDSIAEFWVRTKDERLALKKAGHLSAEAATALNTRLKAVDAELAAAEKGADDEQAPEPAAPPAADDPIQQFDREYRAKLASINSVTELHAYVESTLKRRNELANGDDKLLKAWRQAKIDRQAVLNGIAPGNL